MLILLITKYNLQQSGPAELSIQSVEQCPEPDQYKYAVNVQRHKINRTHEAFDGDTNLGIPLDDKTGVSNFIYFRIQNYL